MTLWLYAGAAIAYVVGCVTYFHGRFHVTALLGLAFAALSTGVVVYSMGPVGAAITLFFLCLAPGGFVVVHWVDAKKGIFYLPTIYSIPIAFICGLLLWLVAGVAMLVG